MDAQRKDAKKESHRKCTQTKTLWKDDLTKCKQWVCGMEKNGLYFVSQGLSLGVNSNGNCSTIFKAPPHRPSHLPSMGAKAPQSLNMSTFGAFSSQFL